MILTLMRYPLPTPQELGRYRQALDSVSTKEEFLHTLCWLDEYDEISIPNIEPHTPFITATTKAFLYWLFSYKGNFHKGLLLHFLAKHTASQQLDKYYQDYFDFGY